MILCVLYLYIISRTHGSTLNSAFTFFNGLTYMNAVTKKCSPSCYHFLQQTTVPTLLAENTIVVLAYSAI